jgi:RimJ/RimL family protein N-acetyltransferase
LGYGARALALLCTVAAEDPELTRLEARIDADNLASRRTAEANGFIDNGLIEDEAQDGQIVMRRIYLRAP